jgi:aminomethyltransferase
MAASSDHLARTPLHGWHEAHGGRMVEFGGWSMPVQYASIVDEHRAVRTGVGLFDIGHMGRLEFRGPGALGLLERATTNHVARLAPGRIQYSLICDEAGGVRDDVLVYRLPGGLFTMVCNASNRGKVLADLRAAGDADAAGLVDLTEATAMIAVQGPLAEGLVAELVAGCDVRSLAYYACDQGAVLDGTPALVSRTGYTGEDGFELIVPAAAGMALWERLLEHGAPRGARPCGLGARDTLRLEAGMPLYGHELSEAIDPYEAGLGWAVKLDKGEFVGREALRSRKAARRRQRIGLAVEGKRIARQGAEVYDAAGRRVGEVTSGTFSPSLDRAVAMALVERGAAGPFEVDVRGTRAAAAAVPLPFYRRPA